MNGYRAVLIDLRQDSAISDTASISASSALSLKSLKSQEALVD